MGKVIQTPAGPVRLDRLYSKNAEYTWRKRNAASLWKAAEKANPDGTGYAHPRAQKIARRIVERLLRFADCELGGMIGRYWWSVLECRRLFRDEAQKLSVQLWGTYVLATGHTPERHDKGRRSPKRPAPLRDDLVSTPTLLPEDEASLREEIARYIAGQR